MPAAGNLVGEIGIVILPSKVGYGNQARDKVTQSQILESRQGRSESSRVPLCCTRSYARDTPPGLHRHGLP